MNERREPRLQDEINKAIRKAWRTDAKVAYQEALVRIERAADARSRELSFATLRALDHIPPLDGVEAVESVILRNTRVVDLSPLNRLPNLRHLDLSSTTHVNLHAIPDYVEEVWLNASIISNLSPLNRLSKLRVLRAGSTEVQDLSGLNLPALKMLSLANTSISNISPLSHSTNLESLSISNTRVSDLAPLATQKNMLRLACSQTRISNLEPIRYLTKLTNLSCFRTAISRLHPLADLQALRSLNIFATKVSDLSPLRNVPSLAFINLTSNHITDISHLASLNALTNLVLRYTQVSNISPLSRLLALTSLDLFQTKVVDLSPLSDLTSMRKLDIGKTLVTDLAPLANLMSLIEGAEESPKKAGLFFLECPLSDDFLRSLATEGNPKRTIEVITYLRGRQGLSNPVTELERDAVSAQDDGADAYPDDDTFFDMDADLPPQPVIPEQVSTALTFTSASEGPLAILAEAIRPPIDPEQVELYARLRKQLSDLLEHIPSQERVQITTAVEDCLRQPDSWDQVNFKKLLWLCGNVLRNVLAQHDTVANDPEPHYAKLPPAVAEALRRPVETWNIVVLGDRTLRELDALRIGPQEFVAAENQLAAADQIVTAAISDRLITTPDAASAIAKALVGASADQSNVHVRQAQEFARGTVQNLIVQMIRGAYRVAQDLQDPQSDEARNFAREYKSGIYKKLGEWTVIGSVGLAAGAGAAAYIYAVPFFEFVVEHAPWLKAYLAVTFENSPIAQIIDAIRSIRARLSDSEGGVD